MTEKYLGIVPYDENCGFEFVGRNDEMWALYERIFRNDYTVYYAASGEGKSSLIKAGLIPVLRRRDYYPVYIVFEDKEFSEPCSIARIIRDRIRREEAKSNKVKFEQSEWSKSVFNDELSTALKENIWWELRNYCFRREDSELKPLYIFDQFEEVFTKAGYDWTESFFAQLEELSTDYVPNGIKDILMPFGGDVPVQKHFKALFSLRTEYLGDIDYWCVQKHFIPALQENRMCLKPLTIKGAQAVISLNESAFGEYKNDIIKGCSAPVANLEDDNQPCVYALILSVVCQTLSRTPDEERAFFLEKLKKDGDREQSIDDILLQFYKDKLRDAGLDYTKDKEVIFSIEDALVDEKGKRCRRDSDEKTLRPLMKWIDPLCEKSNGLIKIVGRRKADGETIKTVEFPHDRLCKAIDSSRKERQKYEEWKHYRQSEWIQFFAIILSFGCVAFLYNSMLSSIRNLVRVLVLGGAKEVISLFIHSYIQFKPSLYCGSVLLDADYSILMLIGFFTLFVPLFSTSIIRKERRWRLTSIISSLVGVLILAFLCIRNLSVDFQNGYVKTITFVGLFASIICFFRSLSNFRKESLHAPTISPSRGSLLSFWPLCGGLFFVGCYAFYETLFRTTFGLSEPIDSSWAIVLLPLLFAVWIMGVFNMKIEDRSRYSSRCFFFASVIVSVFLLIIRVLEEIGLFSDSLLLFVFVVSLLLVVLLIFSAGYVLWHTESDIAYFELTESKRIFSVVSETLLILTIFLLNLGYNPFAINPGKVSHVSSWRTVDIFSRDSLGNKLTGIVNAVDGLTIIPCCNLQQEYSWIRISSKIDISPFKDGHKSIDGSLVYDAEKDTLIAKYLFSPVWEQKFNRIVKNGLRDGTVESAVDYYAAQTFLEIRKANLDYVMNGKVYNMDMLHTLPILDSLQSIVLSKELEKMSVSYKDSTITPRGFLKVIPRAEVLEDHHMVGFLGQLTKSFLVCLIKDRANKSDMSSMQTLANEFICVFFPNLDGLNAQFNTNITINGVNKLFTVRTEDFNAGKLYAWYDMFCLLCCFDMSMSLVEMNNINEELLTYLDSVFILEDASSVNRIEKLIDCLPELQKILSLLDYTEADQSFGRLKTDVSEVLLPLMSSRTDGIYNNMCEEIIKQLVMVSVSRGYSIQKDTSGLSSYYFNKEKVFKTYIEGENKVDEVRSKLSTVIETEKSLLRELKSAVQKAKIREQEMQEMINSIERLIEEKTGVEMTESLYPLHKNYSSYLDSLSMALKKIDLQ